MKYSRTFSRLFLWVVSMIPLMAVAQQRSLSEVLDIAKKHYQQVGAFPNTRSNSVALTPSSRLIPLEGDEAFYLCDAAENGFVLVSADERMPEILGYSFSGYNPERGLPSGLLSVMRGYANIPQEAGAFYAPTSATASVAPMLKTKWDQGEPYNNMCPLDGRTRSVVGCVATAAAQVMKYYEYPEKYGTGKIKYTTESTNIPVSIDLKDYSFAWNMMKDTYIKGEYSNAQGSAVAKLMFAVSAASEMDFSRTESGTTVVHCSHGMRKYFGYDKDMCSIVGSFLTFEHFNDILVKELNQSHPIIFSGFDDVGESGHSFVLDGYENRSGNIYYHVNWGWSGEGDGYYLVNKLTPSSGGIGMGMGTYNDMQLFILNCQPDDGASSPVYATLNDVSVNKNKFASGEKLLFDMNFDILYCLLSESFSGSLLVELVDDKGNVKKDIEVPGMDLPDYDGVSFMLESVDFSTVGDGAYTVRAALKKKSDGKRVDLLSGSNWPVLYVGIEPSAIDGIQQEGFENKVYDLQGQKKKNASNGQLPAGFYIVNGQKVIVRQ